MIVYLLKGGVLDRSLSAAMACRIVTSQGLLRFLSGCEQQNLCNKGKTIKDRKKLSWMGAFFEVNQGAADLTKENFSHASGVLIDIDQGIPDIERFLDQVALAFHDVTWAWWETLQSVKGNRRVRLLLPCLLPLTEGEKAALWSQAVLKLVDQGCPLPDKSSKSSVGLHGLPIHGYGWGVVNPDAGWIDRERWGAAPAVLPLGLSAQMQAQELPPDTVLVAEDGTPFSLGDVTPKLIKELAREGENKIRCSCPVEETESMSALCQISRGRVQVVCSAEHNHGTGQVWYATGNKAPNPVPASVSGGSGKPPPSSGSGGGGSSGKHNGYLIPWPFKVSGKALVKVLPSAEGKSEALLDICSQVPIVTTLYLDSETSDEWWQVEWTGVHGPAKVTIRRDDAASAQKLTERAGRVGLDLHEGNKKIMTQYLSAFVGANHDIIPKQSITSRLGWFDNGFMYGQEWLSFDGSHKELVCRGGEQGIAKALHSAGNYQDWIGGVKLLLAYPIAFAGMLASVASGLLPIVEPSLSSVLEWASSSGTGKTVSMRMAETIWGQPEEIESAWDLTSVGFEFRAAFLSCIPLYLDDTKNRGTTKNSIDVEKAVYKAVAGEGKVRGTPGGNTQAQNHWALNMLSTGEEPIYGMTPSGGARARIVSLQFPPFGIDSKGPVKQTVGPIASLILPNYGHFGRELVLYVAKRRGRFKAAYEKFRDQWAKKLAGHSVADRVSIHFGMLEVASRTMEAVIRQVDPTFTIDHPVILDELKRAAISVDAASGEVDPIARSRMDFYNWCLQRRSRFWTSGGDKPQGVILGRWDGADNWETIFILPDAIAEFLKMSSYHFDARSLASKWADLGFVSKTETGSITQQVRFSSGRAYMYGITKGAVDGLMREA